MARHGTGKTRRKSLSGTFLRDHIGRALPTETQERAAVSLGTHKDTLSRWYLGQQRVSPEKGYRLSIQRVLWERGVLDEGTNGQFWRAYDHLWRIEHGEEVEDEPPTMASAYLLRSRGTGDRPSEDLTRRDPPLAMPEARARSHHFSRRSLPLLGRNKDLARLRTFLDSPEPVSWVQVAGSGGQGKSRLALECALEAAKGGWHAGFVPPDALRRFLEVERDWLPARDTLVVVDYVIGFEEDVGYALRELAVRRVGDGRVRVVIVERQRWDRGFNLHAGDVDGLVAGSAASSGVADWYVRLTRSLSGHSGGIEALRHEPSIVELNSLQPEELVGIARLWAGSRASSFSVSDEEVMALLRRIDPAGRPLYAYFLADALIDGFMTKGWTREDLLEHTLTRDQVHRWASRFGGRPPLLGADHPALKIAALATLVGDLDASLLPTVAGWTYPSASIREQATVLLDGPMGVSVRGPGDVLHKLEPDILGGWFLLESARQWSGGIRPIVEAAWTLAPRATAATILRLAQDFPAHRALGSVLATQTPSDLAERAYREVSSGLLIALRGELRTHRDQILPRIEAAAQEGDRDAMARLGLCYQDAIGMDTPDLAKARLWFTKAAELGDGRSMAYLGHWCFTGREGPPDHAAAFEWFSRGAEAGDGQAMGYLGMCHHNGYGTAKDVALAIRWFQRGSEAGDGMSAVYLGWCHSEGMGVDRDDEEAFKCFRQAADLGSGHALAYLGKMHLEGRGTPRDLGEAVRCFRAGADAGSAAAAAYLGRCLVEGLGLPRDVEDGLRHIRKGVDGLSGYAMFLLGECHSGGVGVERDEARAVELWRKAERLGDDDAKRRLATLGVSQSD